MMKFISFYIIYFFIRLFSFIPFSWLYSLSALLYVLVLYIFPYRQKIVYNNIRQAFPSWDDTRIRKTVKKFYRFFCDMLIESVFFINLKEKELEKRFVYKNYEMINELYNKGKSIILVAGHYANWEWTTSISRLIDHQAFFVYKPLQNKYFDKLLIGIRERFGGKTVAMEKTLRILMEADKNNTKTLTYLVADQRPLKKHIQYWTTFLNQDTPIYNGPEKIARKLDMAVIYMKTTRKARGQYEAEFSLIAENPAQMREFEIMNIYFKKLEETITEAPEYWLWTHNRWKFKKEDLIQHTKTMKTINQ